MTAPTLPRGAPAMILPLLLCAFGCGPSGTASGAPCWWPSDCPTLDAMLNGGPVEGRWFCEQEQGYTCQGICSTRRDGSRSCPDGTPCARNLDCVSDEFELVDTCVRGGGDCPEGLVCTVVPPGVRRCLRSGCRPELRPELCAVPWVCLHDPEEPEDPDAFVCWPGGATPFGEPCSDSYECATGMACNAAGSCSYACVPDPCEAMTCAPEDVCELVLPDGINCPPLCWHWPSTVGHVCIDFVCAPPDTM